MPLEVVLLAPKVMGVAEQREFGELLTPPLVVREERGGGVLTFSEFDDTAVLVLSRPKRIERLEDVRRVLGPITTIPEDSRYWIEGVVPFDYARGMTVVFALEAALGGTAIVRGAQL